MDAPASNPNAVIASIVLPFFYAAVYLDFALSRWQGRGDYDWKDTVTSLGVSIINSAIGVLTILVRLVIYTTVYQHYALSDWSAANPWTWVIGLVLYDFTYYWQHRKGHEWNLLWASHVVHHSSERFNLSTALRVPSASMHLWTWLFALPLALLGIPPMVYAVAALLNLLYQFWIHTERIGKLGWFDRWFGSPSNHRVHHGVNDRYLDTNYGGILMLWDRWFGSYAEELDLDPPRYGTRAPVRSWNPLWVNLDTLWALTRDALRARRWRDAAVLWLRHPGWRPADVAAADPKPAFDLATHTRFDSAVDPRTGSYALSHSALLAAQLVHLIALAPTLGWQATLAYALYQSAGSITLGLLMSAKASQRRLGGWLEAGRLLLSMALAASGVWFGGLALPGWARLVVVLTALLSLLLLPRLIRGAQPPTKLRSELDPPAQAR